MSRVVTSPPSGGLLPDGSSPGGWWHDVEDGRIECDLCPRRCNLKPGDRGFCFVRENRDGQMLLTTYGRSTGFCVDPIEKKPLNHFFPGTSVLSFGTAGCNLGCKFCQNWSISKSREIRQLSEAATPETIAEAAAALQCRSVAFTYNDPVIWAEYAIDTAKVCRQHGIKTVAVTAGYITEQARRPFFDWIDAANVDLKAFTEEFYQRQTLSHLQPVLDTLAWLKQETDVWFEITNLVIPDANDEDDEFRRMCDWILANVGDSVPLHFTAFHPDFRMKDRGATPPETLLRAYDLARTAGIRYVYVGNVNDLQHQSTYCPGCGQVVIERDWYQLGRYQLVNNKCSHCAATVAGHFDERPGQWGRRRLPVRIADFCQGGTQDNSTRRNSGNQRASSGGVAAMSQSDPTGDQTNDDVRCPELSKSQEKAALRAASEMVLAAVQNRRPTLSDPTIADAADKPVFGCFVSIKRKGRLRGCCGFLGRRVPLLAAIQESATTSAVGDVRMPSVSLAELPFLDFEVWLLHDQKAIQSQGEARLKEVTIGKHGLQIQRGDARGLLLPGVAEDHNLDADGFLQQVCLKAGLPPTAWKEDDVLLASFEGYRIDGPFDGEVADSSAKAPALRFTQDDIDKLTLFCRDNIWSISRGAVPNYYLPGVADGSVQAINLLAWINDPADAMQLAKLTMRGSVPVQATLQQMCQTIGDQMRSDNLMMPRPEAVQIALGVLYDPAMHGSVADPDLDGVDPQYRALLVSQKPKSAWIFDPTMSASELLGEAAQQAEITLPEVAWITSFVAQTSESPMSVVNIPRPHAGARDRPAAVAGRFYPDDPAELERKVDELTPTDTVKKGKYRAALVPHAGFMFSGRIAADVLRRVEIPSTVIVIGPKHTALGVDWAIAPHQNWLIPGHSIPSDPELAKQLSESIEGLQLDAAAHQREHAIEVELPFLARFAPHAKVIGIAIGQANLQRCQTFATGLSQVLADRIDDTLLVISSDMNHFANDAENRRVDAMAIEAMEQKDPTKLYRTVRDNNISMCGMLPACMILQCLQQMNLLTQAEKVNYGTSADTTGDTSRVVGYAGMLFR